MGCYIWFPLIIFVWFCCQHVQLCKVFNKNISFIQIWDSYFWAVCNTDRVNSASVGNERRVLCSPRSVWRESSVEEGSRCCSCCCRVVFWMEGGVNSLWEGDVGQPWCKWLSECRVRCKYPADGAESCQQCAQQFPQSSAGRCGRTCDSFHTDCDAAG